MAPDSKTEFRLGQLEGRQATLSDRIHKLGNDVLAQKLTQDSNSFIDWKEWRTQVLIWITVGVLGIGVTAIIFYMRNHI